MKSDRAIFFTHYKVGTLEKINSGHIEDLNPDWDFYTIGFEGHNLLGGSLIANRTPYPNNVGLSVYSNIGMPPDWYDCDLLFCEAQRLKPKYKHYFFIEYDTICNVPIEDFFDIRGDFFGSNVEIDVKDWEWVQRYKNFDNSKDMDFAGSGQSTAVYFSSSILKKYRTEITKNRRLYSNMLCELRLGTIMKKLGVLKNSREDINRYINWSTEELYIDTNIDYFYHPVKQFIK